MFDDLKGASKEILIDTPFFKNKKLRATFTPLVTGKGVPPTALKAWDGSLCSI